VSVTRVGQVRPSQLLYTYGPGSLIDLPHLSVLVSGLDAWGADPAASPEIVEKRLLAAVRRRLGSQVQALRLPPHLPETRNPLDDWARVGVPVAVFPRWLRCPACDRIAPCDSGLFDLKAQPFRPDLTRYHHANCNKAKGKAPPAVPVRFLLACRSGHLDEFPWVAFAHRGTNCGTPLLELFERNQSSRADDVLVTCKNCGSTRSMVDAFGEAGEQNLPKCRGRHPHLRAVDQQPCSQRNRALLLGASNTWFSVGLTVLAVPPLGPALAQLVDDLWPHLSAITSTEVLEYALTTNPALRDLAGHAPPAIWEQIEAHRSGGGPVADEDEDLLAPEWAQLSDPAHAANGPDFRLREVDAPPSFGSIIKRVVLAERLREVVALVGFTRIDPPGEPDVTGTPAPEAPIARGIPPWIPCTEVRGEGVFIQFDEKALAKWEASVESMSRLGALEEAHERWRARRRRDPTAGWPGARYLAVHTFSHLLMRELALECGYGSASISERLYARSGADPMAGVLLYTAAPDSEGTLGGLVSLGDPLTLDRLLRQALARAALCAADPMCAEHIPDATEDALYGAACHACLFAPETSCEQANRYLDRTFAVDTFAEVGMGLFSESSV
jgi:hypothetical protein